MSRGCPSDVNIRRKFQQTRFYGNAANGKIFIAGKKHFKLVTTGIQTDKVTNFAIVKVGRKISRVKSCLVRRTNQNLGRGQFIGHHGKINPSVAPIGQFHWPIPLFRHLSLKFAWGTCRRGLPPKLGMKVQYFLNYNCNKWNRSFAAPVLTKLRPNRITNW